MYLISKVVRGVTEKVTPCRTDKDLQGALPAKAGGSIVQAKRYLELKGNSRVLVYQLGAFQYFMELGGLSYGNKEG